MMSELRQKFEALPLIYQLMDDGFVFVEVTQEYTRKDHTEHRLVIATVNGAWYAFREQQSEIDQLEVQLSLQRDRNKALEAELTSSRNYGDQLLAEKAGLLKAIDDEVKRCVESANAPIRDDHDKGWRNAMLSVRDGFERLRGEHE